ncbi:MAG TPA: inner membrane CreD family protein [Candidatus Polarisedimenticolia bacterium]|nr:inner membrane CreD family protein [Candidatus Polarisedimenticolia bacterium]
MVKRLVAIIFIFVCLSIAWFVLGATIFYRTDASKQELKSNVVSTWGAPQSQTPPEARYARFVTRTIETAEEGRKIVRTLKRKVVTPLPLESSRIEVRLDLEHRQKGLLWYSTYKVAFSGTYAFRNESADERSVTFALDFPTSQAIYDDLSFTLDGRPLTVVTGTSRADTAADEEQGSGDSESGEDGSVTRQARATARVGAGKTALLKVAYRSQGLDTWRYNFGQEVAQVRDFVLHMTTNFKEIDFPPETLSPSEKQETAGGWDLTWAYKNLVSGFQIGMVMPEKLQPGPLAARISLFAPVSLYFFFFLMFIITTLRGIELHPMNYLFLGCAFFSFHLLMAYLVDHISIHAAFVICSVVSIFLVISYLRLVVGVRFAAVEAGLAQLIYLVLFSYAFFFKGFTGLSITIGSIVSLFVVMQMTGRVRWAEKFAGKSG